MGDFKNRQRRAVWCVLLLLVFQQQQRPIRCDRFNFPNVLIVNQLDDGEVETRIRFRKICAKETTVGKGSASSLKYRQLQRGHNLLQLIYDDGNELSDCEYLQDEASSTAFLNNFKRDISNMLTTSNVTVRYLGGGKRLTDPEMSWLDMRLRRKECKKLQMRLKAEVTRKSRDSSLTNVTTTIRRERRGLSDLLRVPGTKWCGKGYSADKYTRLGLFSRTDRCCRKHDTTCPFWIGGFSTKYGLYNWRVNTIMHCGCDERFRACLKLVGTSDANMVGKLFFNVVQSRCFVLKRKKQCVKRSWWGKCERHRIVKHAVLRDNLPY